MTGAEMGYVAKAPVEVTMTPDYQAGVELTSENGCGSLCGYFKAPDQLKKYDISFTLCDLDAELINILTSDEAEVITAGGNSIGYAFPRATSCSGAAAPNGVSLEFWSRRWDACSTPSGNEGLYWRWSLPRAYLNVGAITLGNDFLKVPIEGFLQENGNWNRGPFGDFPIGGAPLLAVGAVTEDDALPTVECGWVSV